MIDNLRSTALLLENQDSLLETVLSKNVCDIIDHVKIKKLIILRYILHLAKEKIVLIQNVKNVARSIQES